MSLESLVELLKELRKAARLSQREVSEELGWHQTEISQLELGHIKRPPAEALIKLGALYGLTPNELARRAGWWHGTEDDLDDPYWALLRQTMRDFPDDERHQTLRLLNSIARGRLKVKP